MREKALLPYFPKRPWTPFLIGVLAIIWISFQIPTPAQTLTDADFSMQLLGGRQIAFGQLPFIDWHSAYGPLVFFSSYGVSQLGGGRLLGDFLLSIFAYAAGYVLLYQGVLWVTGKRDVAIFIVLTALTGFPRFYKYYILLCPIAALGSVYLYLLRPVLHRLFLMSAAVVIAGLYRPDFGIYSALAAVAGICLAAPRSNPQISTLRARVRHAAFFCSCALACASPWLLLLAGKGKLATYLRESSGGASSLAQGLRLPIPTLTASEPLTAPSNLIALSYLFWWGLIPLAAVLLFRGWRILERIRRQMIFVTLILAGTSMVQAMHRADYVHLMQAVSTNYIVLGFVLAEGIRRLQRRRRGEIATGIVTLFVVGMGLLAWETASAKTGPIASINFRGPQDLAWYYSQRPEGFVERYRQVDPTNYYFAVIDAINRIASPREPILATHYLPNLCLFSGHPFAAGQMFVVPGFFTSDADQDETIRRLVAENLPPVVELEVPFDYLPERAPARFSARLIGFIHQHYTEVHDPTVPPPFQLWQRPGAHPAPASATSTSASAPAIL